MIKKNMTSIARATVKKRQYLSKMRSSSCNTGKPQITLNNKYIQGIFMIVNMDKAI